MSVQGAGRPAMLVLTPSYRPHHELCVDLNRSVLRFAPSEVRHSIIVPSADVRLFRSLTNDRTTVIDVHDVMPHQLRKVPRLNMWLNVRAPYPPVRGWIAQQVVKLAAVASAQEQVVLVADSDMVFIRPFSSETFAPEGVVPLYRWGDAVTSHLPRHMLWHDTARRLLGLPASTAAARPDYVCWPCAWEPAVVRRMLARVEEVTGMPWATAVSRQLHFSEMMLYGIYVDELESTSRQVPYTAEMPCSNYSDEVALDRDGFASFLARVREQDVAVMVSAKSGTPLALRRRMLSEFVPPVRGR